MTPLKEPIGYPEALGMVLSAIRPLGAEVLPLSHCVDRAVAEDLCAYVDSPSVDASLKDGYAFRSIDIRSASLTTPCHFPVIGTAAAGHPFEGSLLPGTAVRILTGAKVPVGADTVVPEEHLSVGMENVTVTRPARPGQDIFPKGADVAVGEKICVRGDRLTPGKVALLAAAGFSEVPVTRSPKVGIIATGDEVVQPGGVLSEGKLYASNMAALAAWCRRFSMDTWLRLVGDEREALKAVLAEAIDSCDALLTSGGAWTGDRDLTGELLDELGWQKSFHRIRISPGKAVGFGVLEGKPVFILPGGPPANLTAFIQLALPGLLTLAGFADPFLPTVSAVLDQDVVSSDVSWTHFVLGVFRREGEQTFFSPMLCKSRIQSMAGANGMIRIPEGAQGFSKGTLLQVQLLF